MRSVLRTLSLAALAAAALAPQARAAADIKSAGSLAFGPDGILFVADQANAAVYAFKTGDAAAPAPATLAVKAIDEKIAALLGTTREEIAVNDLAVSPVSHAAYLSVSRGRGAAALPALIKVAADGSLSAVDIDKLEFTKAVLPDAPAAAADPAARRNPRAMSITDLAFADGKVLVAGLSNEEFSSNLRTVAYPFQAVDKGTSVEIFHGNHGRLETNSPIRTFLPYSINGEQHILAAYTCTPLVKFPVSALSSGAKIKGTTLAELGNRSTPMDMIVYNKAGQDFFLMANTARGVMKFAAKDLGTASSITEKVEAETAGVPFETLADWKEVTQLALLDDANVLAVRGGDLQAVALP